MYRDLVAYTQASGAEVFAYQDNDGAEIDAVLVSDGAWAGFEVRCSGAADVLDIAAAGPCYTRPDGVSVISIPHLGP